MRSGIADYSADLLPFLASRATVDAVAPLRDRPTEIPSGVGFVDARSFRSRRGEYDRAICHIGNSPLNEFAYVAAVRDRSVMVLHDLTLHHLFANAYLSRGDRDGYESLLRVLYGPAGERLIELQRRGLGTEYDRFLFPMIEHVPGRAAAVVVHSRAGARAVAEVAPDVPVTVIPHHAGVEPAEVTGVGRTDARDALGLPEDAFVVVHLGFLVPAKQPATVLHAFARLADRHPEAILLIVGQDAPTRSLGRALDRYRHHERVRMTGYVGLPDFYRALRAADAVVNLRFPTLGESSGSFARALAAGRATIVNDAGSFADVPADATLRVELDDNQVEAVAAHLLRLAEDPAMRDRLGAAAREYATAELDPRRCAARYVEAAEASAA
jgi:glycosyltransferase involved in cell wall biosynthesis